MIAQEYDLLGENTEPEFNLDDADLHGGTHLLVMQAVDGEGTVSAYSDPVVYNQEHKKFVIHKDTLTDIANSVRAKTGKTDLIPTDKIAAEISSLVTKTDLKLQLKPCTTNNTTVKPDAGFYGLSEVTVAVPDPPLQSKPCTTNNTTVKPDAGFYGLSEVPVAIPDPPLFTPPAVTKNHTRVTPKDPDTGAEYYGLSSVTVHIPEYNGTVNYSGEVSNYYTHKFIAMPDISTTRIIPISFYGPSSKKEYTHIRVYANTGIRYEFHYGDPLVDDPAWHSNVYTPVSGWISNGASEIKVLDYSSMSYEDRGWLEANSQDDEIYQLLFSYNGKEQELPLNKLITIPCADQVVTTDIQIHIKTNLDV